MQLTNSRMNRTKKYKNLYSDNVYTKIEQRNIGSVLHANLQSSSSPEELLQRRRATRTTTQTSITMPSPSTTIIKGIVKT